MFFGAAQLLQLYNKTGVTNASYSLIFTGREMRDFSAHAPYLAVFLKGSVSKDASARDISLTAEPGSKRNSVAPGLFILHGFTLGVYLVLICNVEVDMFCFVLVHKQVPFFKDLLTYGQHFSKSFLVLICKIAIVGVFPLNMHEGLGVERWVRPNGHHYCTEVVQSSSKVQCEECTRCSITLTRTLSCF